MALMFKFISGKYKGGEFPLDKDVIVIGRHSDLEMVLSEDMVSRRHAKITISGNDVILEDMGSTNGTFVNGSRIKKIKLKINDRILIGTSIAKFIDSDDTGQNMEDAAKIGTNAVSGSIEDIPIPEVLQLLATSKKTGVLRVTSGSISAEIQLLQGIFKDVTMIGSDADPKKILIKLIKLDSGFFEFEQKDPGNFGNRLNISLDAFLLELAKYEDEVGLDDLDFELDDDDDLILDDFDEVSVNVDDMEDDVLDFDDFNDENIETASEDDIFSLDDLDDEDDDFALDDLIEDSDKKESSKSKDDNFNLDDDFALDDLDNDDDFALDDLNDEPQKEIYESAKSENDDFNLDDLDNDDDFALDDLDDEPQKEIHESAKSENDDFNLDDLDNDDDFALDDLDDEPQKETPKSKDDDFNLDDLDNDDFALDDLDDEPQKEVHESAKPENDDFNLDDLDNDNDFNLDSLEQNENDSEVSDKSNETQNEDFSLEDLDVPSDEELPHEELKPEINLEELKEKFPLDDEYVLPLPLFSPLDELNKNELKVLQLVHNFASISEIIENTELSEEETYVILDKLVEEDYIEQ